MSSSKNHILIIDGTLSKLDNGFETHCGKLYKLLTTTDGKNRKIYYDPGVQGSGLYKWVNIASGLGLNLSIIRSLQRLSENYRTGDKIYLFGYSRGAYAIRLLAGLIDKIGMMKPEFATKAIAELAFELLTKRSTPKDRTLFREKYCRHPVEIEFIGAWDTVKALGLPLPFFRGFSPLSVVFHDNALPSNIRNACHALAYDEDRAAYKPEFWVSHGPNSQLKQVIFKGSHSIIGGQGYDVPNSNYLSNITMEWMLENAALSGLVLPENWRERFPTNPQIQLNLAPKLGDYLWRREKRKFAPKELFTYHQSFYES